MKKKKPKMEFRYYKIPADSHMLPLTGENLKQCYGVEVDYLHFHNHMEIGYCYYGEGTLSLENTKHEFQGGMFSIIPRNFPHTTNSKLNTISSWEYLFLDVSSIISQFHQANPILSDKIIRQINKKASFLSEKDYPFTGQLIRRLLALAKEHPVYYKEDMEFEIGKGIVAKDGQDVTIIAAGTVFHKALEAAKLANAAKSDFLSRMSHDIRTPMNAIAGMTEIADAHIREPERVRDCLQKIRLSSNHLLGLINDVLDMSQIESGKVSIHESSLSLPELIREIIMITLPNVRTKQQVFKVHLRNISQEHFYSDELRLRQILLNLLSNASKFTPEKGQIIFEVEQLPGDSGLSFTIADTGPGIKKDFQEHLFETFTRERDSRTDRIEGSGLGLAIVKRLTELMGGDIRLDSEPGQGSAFCVTLPIRPIPAPADGSIDDAGRILLVDTDPVVLTEGRQALESLGTEAYCAESVGEAVDYIRDRYQAGESCRMIIMDWEMLRPDAEEILEQIRRETAGEPPLLIISAYDWSEIKDGVAAGIAGYIEKPFFRSTFRACMLKYLKGEETSGHKAVTYDFHDKIFLLAEDNELNREIAAELLGNFGARLDTAVNGEEALRLFQASAPCYYSLILMDIQMPVMNGYEAAREIRSLNRADAMTIPIIAMTADAFVEDIRNAENAGMNGHMAKPLSFDTLALEIEKYLTSAER